MITAELSELTEFRKGIQRRGRKVRRVNWVRAKKKKQMITAEILELTE